MELPHSTWEDFSKDDCHPVLEIPTDKYGLPFTLYILYIELCQLQFVILAWPVLQSKSMSPFRYAFSLRDNPGNKQRGTERVKTIPVRTDMLARKVSRLGERSKYYFTLLHPVVWDSPVTGEASFPTYEKRQQLPCAANHPFLFLVNC